MQLHRAVERGRYAAPTTTRQYGIDTRHVTEHIRANDQWRICFRFEDGDAYEVEVCDYH
jgi:proteic killer suppression protein